MKHIRIFSLVIVAVCFLVSCKKKTYPETVVEGTPVFYFKGTVNNSPIEIHGGTDSYYMYSSWAQDANGVYGLVGNLRPSNGSQNSIQIQINDQRVQAQNASCEIDSALYNGYYPYKTGANAAGGCLLYSLQFFPTLKNGYYPQYSWNFGDGSSVSTQTSPVHFFKRFQNYNISLTATTGSFGTSTINNWFNTTPGSFNAGITILSDTGKTVSASFKNMSSIPPYLGGVGNVSNFTYTWDFCNDGGCGGSAPTSSSSSFVYANQETARIKLTVTDQSGVSTVARYNHATQLSQACAVNYSYSVTPYPNQKDFSNIIITWTNAAGQVYTSNHSAQPGDSYFQILSVEDYANNEKGEKTKKVHVKFKCTVYPSSTSSTGGIDINNGEAVIAVAYK